MVSAILELELFAVNPTQRSISRLATAPGVVGHLGGQEMMILTTGLYAQRLASRINHFATRSSATQKTAGASVIQITKFIKMRSVK